MAQNNGNIPDDLVLSILSKLPLKSLKRFACVKKSWLHLFDNPIFMSMFRRNFISNCHYGKDSSLLLRKKLPELDGGIYPHELIWISGERFGEKVNLGQFEPPLTYQYFNLVGIGSGIHGIICIFTPSSVYESIAMLWNPATEESLVIPPSPIVSSHFPTGLYEKVPCGFGYDHAGDDYKLIQCICFLEKQSYNIWQIYSVRGNTWRKLDVNMACANPYNEFTHEHVYLNGVCHWRAFREKHLVSFNLNTEEALITPFPPLDMRDDRTDVILDVLNGSIALISTHNNSICISILGEIGVEESWTKLFTFETLPCNFESLYGVGIKGDILYIKKEDRELASFDLITQMVEEIDVKGNMYGSRIIIYKKSLLPIRGINN